MMNLPGFMGSHAPALCEYPKFELKYPYADYGSFLNKNVEEVLQKKLDQLMQQEQTIKLYEELADCTTTYGSAQKFPNVVQAFVWKLWIQFKILRVALKSDKSGAKAHDQDMIIQQIESMVNALIHNDELLNEVIEREQFWSVLDQYVG